MEFVKKYWVQIIVVGIIIYFLSKKKSDKKAETTTTTTPLSGTQKATSSFIDGFLG